MAQQTVNILVLASVYLLFALGLSLVWGAFDILNLAHGSVFMLGAFGAYLVTEHIDLSLIPLVLVGTLTGIVAALLLDTAVFRPLRRRRRSSIHGGDMVIASLAAAIIPVAIAQNVTDLVPFGARTTFNIHLYHVGGIQLANLDIIIVVVTLVITGGLSWWLSRTRAGQAIRALAVDPTMCQLMGINQSRLGMAVMCMGGGLAGLAGVLLMLHLGAVTATIGTTLLLKAFAIIVVGSVGSIWGAALGSVLLAALETILIVEGWGQWQDAVAFLAVVLILLVRPSGLIGKPKYQRV